MAQIRGLACDHCNYDEAWLTSLPIAQVRRTIAAPLNGWHSRNGIDLCEDCWDQGVRYEDVR